jgi:hypothetical protein
VYIAKLAEVQQLGGPVEARAANAAALPRIAKCTAAAAAAAATRTAAAAARAACSPSSARATAAG